MSKRDDGEVLHVHNPIVEEEQRRQAREELVNLCCLVPVVLVVLVVAFYAVRAWALYMGDCCLHAPAGSQFSAVDCR